MKQIAVIGAGASGLAASKFSLAEGHQVTVYEQESDLGGTWLYSEDPEAHSPIYEGMTVNQQKELMEYEDYSFPKETPTFPSADCILSYLRKYAEGIKILFNTKVLKVERVAENSSWKITIRGSDKTTKDQFFDVVFVCSGHFREGRDLFDHSAYQGRFIHSHGYRKASDFVNQVVAIVGTSYSGIDIATLLVSAAKQIYFIGNTSYPDLNKAIIYCKGHVIGTSSTKLLLDSGERVGPFDTVIDCTGYKLSFPFLGEGLVQIVYNEKVLMPVWRLIVHMNYPTSFFFIGLNDSLTFFSFEIQVKFALALISARLIPPSYEEMEKWNDERIKYLEEKGSPLSSFNDIRDIQFDYLKELAEMGDFPPKKNIDLIKRMMQSLKEERIARSYGYKKLTYEVDGNDFRIIE